jgi:hypothetical protein
MGGTGLELGTADYADALARDPERRMRLTKFTVEADQRCTAIFLYHASAIVDAVATDGRRLHKEALTNRGSMQCHLTPEDVATRLTTNAGRALPAFVVGDLPGADDVPRRRPGPRGGGPGPPRGPIGELTPFRSVTMR